MAVNDAFNLSAWELQIAKRALDFQQDFLRRTKLREGERPSERAVHLAEIVRLTDRIDRRIAQFENDG